MPDLTLELATIVADLASYDAHKDPTATTEPAGITARRNRATEIVWLLTR